MRRFAVTLCLLAILAVLSGCQVLSTPKDETNAVRAGDRLLKITHGKTATFRAAAGRIDAAVPAGYGYSDGVQVITGQKLAAGPRLIALRGGCETHIALSDAVVIRAATAQAAMRADRLGSKVIANAVFKRRDLPGGRSMWERVGGDAPLNIARVAVPAGKGRWLLVAVAQSSRSHINSKDGQYVVDCPGGAKQAAVRKQAGDLKQVAASLTYTADQS